MQALSTDVLQVEPGPSYVRTFSTRAGQSTVNSGDNCNSASMPKLAGLSGRALPCGGNDDEWRYWEGLLSCDRLALHFQRS